MEEQKTKSKKSNNNLSKLMKISSIILILLLLLLLSIWMFYELYLLIIDYSIELGIVICFVFIISTTYLTFEYNKIKKTTDSWTIKKLESIPKGFEKWFSRNIFKINQSIGNPIDSTIETYIKVAKKNITDEDRILVQKYKNVYKGISKKLNDVNDFIKLLPGRMDEVPEIRSYLLQIVNSKEELDVFFYEIKIEELTSISEMVFIQKTMQKILILLSELFQLVIDLEPLIITDAEVELRKNLITRGNIKKHLESCIKLMN